MNKCHICQKEFLRTDNFNRHLSTHEDLEEYSCDQCSSKFNRKDNLAAHRKRIHGKYTDQSMSKLWRPWETDSEIHNLRADINLDSSFDESEMNRETEILQLITENADFIETKAVLSKRAQDRYNFKVTDPDRRTLKSYVQQIYQDQKYPFKINISFGFILRHTSTQQLTFYYASKNNRLFEKPIIVSTAADIDGVLEKIDDEDLLEYCRQQRPNSSFIVETITNILFYVDKLRNFNIGCPVVLPDYIKDNPAVIGLEKNHHGTRYTDNLCLFRCLALCRQIPRPQIESAVTEMLLIWCRARGTNPHEFPGIKSDELSIFENIFGIRLEVFELVHDSPDDSDSENDDNNVEVSESARVYAKQVRKSAKMQIFPSLHVCLYQGHFSFIKDIHLFSRKWQCEKCDKLFEYQSRCAGHQQNCSGSINLKFKSGGFGLKQTIFDELSRNGIFVRSGHEFYDYRVAYDFEAFIKNLDLSIHYRKGSAKVLTPASVSVCSNVPGYESAKCFVMESGGDTDLMHHFFQYLSEISDAAFEIVAAERHYIMDLLDEKIENFERLKSKGQQATVAESEERDRLEVYCALKTKFISWMKQIVVLGFNSGKFDLNLIRSCFFPYMLEKGIPVRMIIKKSSSYICLSTDKCLFLDMRNYLSPSVSYDKWIKSLGIEQTKGIFPYEWLNDVTDLSTPYLVPKECFYSTLKQRGITDTEYADLQKIWDDQRFQTMKDLLIWYNNLDTEPFIKAAHKFFLHWKGLGIDPFKSGSISLPGLALTHLMRTLPKHVVLPLVPEKHKDVYFCMRDNIAGGLSNVFHRYHEAGKTLLPNGMPVACIISRDANGLYLYRLGQNTGTGIIQIWRTNEHLLSYATTLPGMSLQEITAWKAVQDVNLNAYFKRESMYPMAEKELEWLEWYGHVNSCHVEHRFNGGQRVIKQSKSVRYPVDGYISSTNTILQFHGCFWHGHECNPRYAVNSARRQSTDEITSNLKGLGYNVQEIWECQWEALKRERSCIQIFVDEHVIIPDNPRELSAAQILAGIRSGELFGLLECSLEVPRFNYELNEFFREFPPIFKNAYVSLDDCGDYMKTFALESGLMKKPRRNLISSYYGEKLLLTSDLVKWYLDKGLEVTRVFQFLQMKPKRCFQHLVDEVTFHRRAADADPSLAPIGSAYKDQGNQYYGKTATNKLKHKAYQLCPDRDVDKLVNDKRFCSMEEVGSDAYELKMDKKRIVLDLPLSVAFFVYGGSKLTMLSFVYDCLKRYLIPGSYQIVNMDTDSIIAAYASRNIDDLVKPELKIEFGEEGKKKFLVTDEHSLRIPGLFKEELVADGIIALCAKTYFAWSHDMTKAVTKGLSKVTNSFSRHDFMQVLETGHSGGGWNYGFRNDGAYLVQYSQYRRSLCNLFVKRKVQADGISTEPLDI